MKKIKARLPTWLLLFGSISVTAGSGMISPPAGYLTGGLLAMVAGVIMVLGGDER